MSILIIEERHKTQNHDSKFSRLKIKIKRVLARNYSRTHRGGKNKIKSGENVFQIIERKQGSGSLVYFKYNERLQIMITSFHDVLEILAILWTVKNLHLNVCCCLLYQLTK